ncbi:MAG: hypothetical protein U1F25_11345 [Rubrivivax sp.]
MSSVTPAPSTCVTTLALAAFTCPAVTAARLPAAARACAAATSVSAVTPTVIVSARAGASARTCAPAGSGAAAASASSKYVLLPSPRLETPTSTGPAQAP